MSITIYGDRINYNGYGDQYIALGSGFGDIGCYVSAVNVDGVNYTPGQTIAGSSLRYSYTATSGFANFYQNAPNSSWNGGGSSLSGTWRKMSTGTSYSSTGIYVPAQGYSPAYTYTQYLWATHLWMRVS